MIHYNINLHVSTQTVDAEAIIVDAIKIMMTQGGMRKRLGEYESGILDDDDFWMTICYNYFAE